MPFQPKTKPREKPKGLGMIWVRIGEETHGRVKNKAQERMKERVERKEGCLLIVLCCSFYTILYTFFLVSFSHTIQTFSEQ